MSKKISLLLRAMIVCLVLSLLAPKHLQAAGFSGGFDIEDGEFQDGELSEPEPTPEPVVPEPEPTPEPVVPEPEPTPEPVVPKPEPTPEPIVPEPEPTPEPVVPEPEPTPKPVVPEPEPTPEPVVPEPESTPEPTPEPTVPKPTPEPTVPETKPTPEPTVSETEPTISEPTSGSDKSPAISDNTDTERCPDNAIVENEPVIISDTSAETVANEDIPSDNIENAVNNTQEIASSLETPAATTVFKTSAHSKKAAYQEMPKETISQNVVETTTNTGVKESSSAHAPYELISLLVFLLLISLFVLLYGRYKIILVYYDEEGEDRKCAKRTFFFDDAATYFAQNFDDLTMDCHKLEIRHIWRKKGKRLVYVRTKQQEEYSEYMSHAESMIATDILNFAYDIPAVENN